MKTITRFLAVLIFSGWAGSVFAISISTTFVREPGTRVTSVAVDAATGEVYEKYGYGPGPLWEYGSDPTTLITYADAAAFEAGTSSGIVTSTTNFWGTYIAAQNGSVFARSSSSFSGSGWPVDALTTKISGSTGATQATVTVTAMGGINGPDTFGWGGFSGVNAMNDGSNLYIVGGSDASTDWLITTFDYSLNEINSVSFTPSSSLGYAFAINGYVFFGDDHRSGQISIRVNASTGVVDIVDFLLEGLGPNPSLRNASYDAYNDTLYVYTQRSYTEDPQGFYKVEGAAELFGVPTTTAIPITDTVIVNGIEWAQPDLFTNLSWNDINAVCPSGICVNGGTLNGYDMTNFIWASVDDVNALFNYYLGGPVLGPGAQVLSEQGALWAPIFFDQGWRVTRSDFVLRYTYGWSRDLHPTNAGRAYSPLWQDVFSDTGWDYASTDNNHLIEASGREYLGGWFYRPHPTVDLIFSSTTGTGTTGTDTIRAKAGDVLTLDIVVSDNGGCTGLDTVVLELNWDAANLTGDNEVNNCVGGCFDLGTGALSTVGPLIVDNVAGNASKYNAAPLFGVTPFNTCEGDGDLTLGSIEFTVDQRSTTEISVGYEGGDAVTTANPNVSFQPDAMATIRPPSGC